MHFLFQKNHHNSSFYDPDRMGFGKLRVLNDDSIDTPKDPNNGIYAFVIAGQVKMEIPMV